jgi:hypothetical protein
MMKNVDVEIYVNQMVSFFEKNPNDLINLIGDTLKDKFFEKIRTKCYENLESGDEISLTQKQLIDIVVELKSEEIVDGKAIIIHEVFEQNKVGIFCLN